MPIAYISNGRALHFGLKQKSGAKLSFAIKAKKNIGNIAEFCNERRKLLETSKMPTQRNADKLILAD